MRVAPKIFQLVERTGVPVKDVYHHVEVIQAYPQRVLLPLVVERHLSSFLFDPQVDIVGDGLYLRVGVPFTDDEEISRGVIQLAQIQFEDLFSFDILNAIYDQFVEGFGGKSFLDTSFSTQNWIIL